MIKRLNILYNIIIIKGVFPFIFFQYLQNNLKIYKKREGINIQISCNIKKKNNNGISNSEIIFHYGQRQRCFFQNVQ